jgi:hypothetical protein
MRVFSAHPKTGIPFATVRLPHWPAARLLVCRAALVFAPIRTVGWDVALTTEGPVLVEGNVWWDPPNESVVGPRGPDGQRDRLSLLLTRLKTELNG